MLNFLKRDQAKDPFGGDDMFEAESRFAGKGPKIALAASVVMFLGLAGTIATIVMTGKVEPPPVAGSFADIEVVDEPAPAAPAPEGKTQTAAAPAAKAPTGATAATDRSVERRPWLAAPAATNDKRPGVNEPPPAKAAAPAKAPETKAPEAKAPEIKTAAKGSEPKAPETKAPETKTALVTPPPAPKAAAAAPEAKAPETKAAAKSPEPKATGTPAPTKAAEVPPEPAKEAPKDVADASPFGRAPGAPSLFGTPAGADAGPAVAGGRPRLVDPAQPPIDKTAIAAPPPRFANIATPRKEAAAAKAAPNTAKVAVVIDGLGLSQTATDAAIAKLPAAVTLAFSPYTRNLKKWTEKAKASGHEVLIQLPMESKEFPAEDPGPLGLLTSVEAKENAQRLDAILKDAGDAVGVFDSEGSKFRESEPHIAAVFTKLKEKNLFYVQGEPGVRVGEANVPVAVADVVLDERPFRAAVDARLDYAERLAKYQGSAVAAVGAKPVSFERLVLWLEQAQKKGVILAPISEVLIRSEAANTPAPAPAAAPPTKGKAGEPAPAKGKTAEEHEAPPAKGKAAPAAKAKTAH